LEEESVIRYKINQITDTGSTVSMALSEDVELENVSQQQMMLEAIDRAIGDKDVKEQIKPILEAILRSQPQTVVKTYSQTIVQITMPRRKYEKINSPRVGDRLLIDIKKFIT
jgi:phage gp29-like protein